MTTAGHSARWARPARRRRAGRPSGILETQLLNTLCLRQRRPFSTLGWPDEDAADLAAFFPTQVMETGHDILFFWVARMIMMSLALTGKAPFHTVLLHGLVS